MLLRLRSRRIRWTALQAILLAVAASLPISRVAEGAGAGTDAPKAPPAAAGSGVAVKGALQKIEENYVDPSRVDPNRMLWAAAAALDREVPEVRLESSPGADAIVLRAAGTVKSFPASTVRSLPLWARPSRRSSGSWASTCPPARSAAPPSTRRSTACCPPSIRTPSSWTPRRRASSPAR